MTADTYTPKLGLIEQGTGNNNNSWGTTFNSSFALIADRAIAGVNTITSTGGTLDYSGSPPPAAARQDVDAIQIANGALVSDLTVIVPNLSKLWWFQNNTSGNFNMYVKTTSGTATQIPQGVGLMVMGDGNDHVIRQDKQEVGSFRLSGKSAAGSGELACSGASLVRTAFPDLFSAIGTNWGTVDGTHFTLPNFTDTGRFLRSSSGALTVGTYQSNQNAAHTHTVTGAPSAGTLGTDSQGAHQHNVYLKDNGHIHSGVPTVAGFATTDTTGNRSVNASTGNSGSATTGITIGSVNGTANDNLTASAGAHTHNVTGAPGIGNLATASQGGTEARPEAAVVLMCIRY